MWIVLGLAAVIFAGLNIARWSNGMNPEPFRFLSLAFTAATIAAEYLQAAQWVKAEDWAALGDVIPTFSVVLPLMVIGSIILNGITLKSRKEHQ